MIPAIFAPVVAAATAVPLLRTVIAAVQNRAVNQKADSLIKFSKSTRVEPITLVDQRLAGSENTSLILNALSALFSAYYLQAVALLVNVGRVNTLRLLDSLNPERDISSAAGAYLADHVKGGTHSNEAYRYGLPTRGRSMGLEAYDPSRIDQNAMNRPGPAGGSGVGFKSDVNDILKETANLSVGRIVEVTIEDEGKKAVFPVMFRLIVTLMDPRTLTHILSDGSRDTSAREMFHDWRAKGGGFKAFWQDIVLATDLIDEHRDALMRDDTNTYANILERRRGNFYTSLLSKTPSIGNAANLIVLTQQTARELETRIGARLDNFDARQRLFKSSYVLIMAVLDEYDRVTFYHRDIKTPTQLSVKELKVSTKGNGLDVSEILKAYQLGNRPTL